MKTIFSNWTVFTQTNEERGMQDTRSCSAWSEDLIEKSKQSKIEKKNVILKILNLAGRAHFCVSKGL